MKKGQMQMGESIAIMIIFFIFISFGMIFYMRIMESGTDTQRMENLQLRVVQVAQRASFLPELQCSEENVRKDNCIDLLKVGPAAEEIENDRLHYYDSFGFSKIVIREVFPEQKQWVIYNNTPTDYKGKMDKKVTFIPIALSNYTQRKYYFGVMEVEVFMT
jgi:hypothetical protein